MKKVCSSPYWEILRLSRGSLAAGERENFAKQGSRWALTGAVDRGKPEAATDKRRVPGDWLVRLAFLVVLNGKWGQN